MTGGKEVVMKKTDYSLADLTEAQKSLETEINAGSLSVLIRTPEGKSTPVEALDIDLRAEGTTILV